MKKLTKPKKLVVLQNITRSFARKTAKLIIAKAIEQNIEVLELESIGGPIQTPDILQGDMIIACGGDGTIIEAAHRSRGTNIPIAGINAGYLGFLSAFSAKNKGELFKGLKKIFLGEYIIEHRATIEALGLWAVNDIVIQRSGDTVIDLQLLIDGAAATDYRGDGLIISTPTGSTAYSLAAGGPVLTSGNQSVVLTPICPHSFANRSIIISGKEKIEVRCNENCKLPAQVYVDGQVREIKPGTKLSIEISKQPMPLVSLIATNRHAILAEKLGWRPLPHNL